MTVSVMCYTHVLACGCRVTYDHFADESFASICMQSCCDRTASWFIGSSLPLEPEIFEARAQAMGHREPAQLWTLEWEA